MSTFIRHIHLGRMVDLLEGRLSADEQKQIEAHLATCPKCSREWVELTHLIELMRTDKGENAPQHLISRIEQLSDSPPAPASDSSELRRRILAAIRFDSHGLAPAFGVRSAAPVARQLLFNAEAHAIDLRIQPEGEAWVVSGQAFGDATANARVELKGLTSASQVILNAQSEFILPAVPAGHYKLILHLADIDVEVDDLNIGT